MTLPLSDDERGLVLSRYLDGELEPSVRAEVECRIAQDAVWAAHLDALRDADRLTRSVVRRHRQNSQFTDGIIQRLKQSSAGRPSARFSARRRARSFRRGARWGWVRPAAALLLIGAGLVYFRQDLLEPGNPVKPSPPAPSFNANAQTITAEVQFISWPDGTSVWARKGSVIESLGRRSLRLTGEALLRVASDKSVPFIVIGPGGTTAQALGTVFDVSASSSGTRVRVAEGHVRVRDGLGKMSADVLGGNETGPEFSVRMFDPRELAMVWQSAPASAPPQAAAPWPQSGGAAGHSGISPLHGPARLVVPGEKFFALPPELSAAEPRGGAVAGANDRAYLVCSSNDPASGAGQTVLLELNLENPVAWRRCAVLPGGEGLPAVITPKGWILFATAQGSFAAYDPIKEHAAWTQNEASGLTALCVTPDGRLLASAPASLLACKAETGEPLWRCAVPSRLNAPATLCPNRLICAASPAGRVFVISPEGQLLFALSAEDAARGPAVAAQGRADQVFLATTHRVVSLSLASGAKAGGGKLEDAAVSCTPLANGLFGAGPLLARNGNTIAARPPASGAFVALAQDGRGQVFAAHQNAIVRLITAADGKTLKEAEYCAVSRGRVVPDGLALTRGRLLVTTTAGLQIFE